MLITLLSAGSRGDVQPFVALGVSLRQAGYRVRVVATEDFGDFIQGFGLEFHGVSARVAQIAADPEMQAATQGGNPLKMLLSFNKLKALAASFQKDYYAGCQGSDAIVYHPGAAIGFYSAQKLKIPSILASPFPLTPTKDFPALLFYNMPRLGKQANLLSHKVFEQVLWTTSSGPLKQFWKQTFGKAPANFKNPFGQQRSAFHPTIVSCSNYVFPQPPDWPEHVSNTGYWFLEEPDWQAPCELQDFLARGPAPVYVGFGSMADSEAAETTKVVMAALERVGQRGILAKGWSGLEHTDTLPENIFMLEQAPHAWLFPRMAAVVHHGGAGTTAAGLRAGVPTVVIPHGLDQFAWGRRVYELGVGPKPIPKKRLRPQRLAEAIQQALTAEMRAAASALGQKIQAENGNATAVKIIEQSLNVHGRTGYR